MQTEHDRDGRDIVRSDLEEQRPEWLAEEVGVGDRLNHDRRRKQPIHDLAGQVAGREGSLGGGDHASL
jgi:hypothetical protein